MKRTIASLLAGLCALLVLPLCACVSGEQIKNYNEGVAAFEAKDYELAKALFLTAGGYANSPSYISAIEEYESIYLEAVSLFGQKQYSAARNSFDAISDFGNSAEYVAFIDRLSARYAEGMEAFERQDYVTALGRFTQALGYEDSDSYVKRISNFESNYQLAMGFYMEGNYEAALATFRKIGVPYKDSEEKIASIYELFERKGITASVFRTLFNESCEAEGEDLRLPVADVNETGFAWRTTNGMLVVGNIDEEGYIRTVSFWVERSLRKDLGEEGVDRLFAHCIHALTSDEATYSDILAELDLYLEGSLGRGGFGLLLEKDASGATVLTATLG